MGWSEGCGGRGLVAGKIPFLQAPPLARHYSAMIFTFRKDHLPFMARWRRVSNGKVFQESAGVPFVCTCAYFFSSYATGILAVIDCSEEMERELQV